MVSVEHRGSLWRGYAASGHSGTFYPQSSDRSKEERAERERELKRKLDSADRYRPAGNSRGDGNHNNPNNNNNNNNNSGNSNNNYGYRGVKPYNKKTGRHERGAERGRGGGGPSFQAVVNQKMKAAQTVEVLLGLVVEHEARFNVINVSTAVNTLKKLACATRVLGRTPVGKMLHEDAGFAKLIDLVRLRCDAFGERQIANVLNGLAALHTDLGVTSVNVRLADQLVKVLERVAHNMNGQEIANTLNALCKLQGAAGAMSPAGWDAMARAAKHTAPRMNQQEVGNTLNALSKVEAAAVAMSPAGWAAMARAAKHTAPTMNAQGVGNTLNALSKVEAAAGAMSPAGWAAMARAVERTALTMNAQDLANSLAAIASLPNARAKMSESAFKRLEAAGVKLASEMNSKETEMTRWACQKFFRA